MKNEHERRYVVRCFIGVAAESKQRLNINIRINMKGQRTIWRMGATKCWELKSEHDTELGTTLTIKINFQHKEKIETL